MKAVLSSILLIFTFMHGHAQCPPGQVRCAGICVDLGSNRDHCGTCGNQCPESYICSAGICSCPDGYVSCGGICVNLSTDTNHCGTCGNQCKAGHICINGICSCTDGYTDCGGTCVNLDTDTNNCGTCGNKCPAGYTCIDGMCAPNTAGIRITNNEPARIFVYPNPVNNLVQLRSASFTGSKVNIILYDSKAAMVNYTFEGKAILTNDTLSIYLPENLAAGIFFLNIQSAGFNKIIKIIKE